MIEQIDLVGQCSLYASSSVPNPGPLDLPGIVERNEDPNVNFRSVHVTLPHTQDRVSHPYCSLSVLCVCVWYAILGNITIESSDHTQHISMTMCRTI